jgi:hypothetical protein
MQAYRGVVPALAKAMGGVKLSEHTPPIIDPCLNAKLSGSQVVIGGFSHRNKRARALTPMLAACSRGARLVTERNGSGALEVGPPPSSH